jgi:hypothetical protein
MQPSQQTSTTTTHSTKPTSSSTTYPSQTNFYQEYKKYFDSSFLNEDETSNNESEVDSGRAKMNNIHRNWSRSSFGGYGNSSTPSYNNITSNKTPAATPLRPKWTDRWSTSTNQHPADSEKHTTSKTVHINSNHLNININTNNSSAEPHYFGHSNKKETGYSNVNDLRPSSCYFKSFPLSPTGSSTATIETESDQQYEMLETFAIYKMFTQMSDQLLFSELNKSDDETTLVNLAKILSAYPQYSQKKQPYNVVSPASFKKDIEPVKQTSCIFLNTTHNGSSDFVYDHKNIHSDYEEETGVYDLDQDEEIKKIYPSKNEDEKSSGSTSYLKPASTFSSKNFIEIKPMNTSNVSFIKEKGDQNASLGKFVCLVKILFLLVKKSFQFLERTFS